MNAISARTKLRQTLGGTDCSYAASVFDPISLRMASRLGFKTGVLGGSIASLSVLGAPDLVLLTMSELAEQARRICRAEPDFPVIVDADHGYGNALNVRRTVEELEATGVAGLTIEDTELPVVTGGRTHRLVSLETGLGKIEAAIQARREASLVIIARTSAVQLSDAADAARRCNAYAAAGADAIFLSGVKSAADVETVSRAVTCPIILGAMPAGMQSPERSGVRLALSGHKPLHKAIATLYQAMQEEARARGIRPRPNGADDAPELLDCLTCADQYEIWTNTFVR